MDSAQRAHGIRGSGRVFRGGPIGAAASSQLRRPRVSAARPEPSIRRAASTETPLLDAVSDRWGDSLSVTYVKGGLTSHNRGTRGCDHFSPRPYRHRERRSDHNPNDWPQKCRRQTATAAFRHASVAVTPEAGAFPPERTDELLAFFLTCFILAKRTFTDFLPTAFANPFVLVSLPILV